MQMRQILLNQTHEIKAEIMRNQGKKLETRTYWIKFIYAREIYY